MIRNRLLLKTFTVFFLLEIVTSAVAPAVSWALTAGPTSPDAWSFEPVDTTDIVDLKTGDFVYNIPLLEVPGPAGSYPVNLSYHAGILPDQEASWVGLGFDLNTGSIARLVNGYPDDHNNVTGTDRSYWQGGSRTETTVGISLGYANCATVSGGLVFAHDTYKGSHVGGYLGVGIGIYGEASAEATLNFSPYGGISGSAGIGVGINVASIGALGLGGSTGLSINSQSGLAAGANAGINAGGISLLGSSISSQGGGKSLTVAGVTQVIYNSNANHVSTKVKGFNVDIPVWYGISVRLGRTTTRYWTDETSFAHTFGSLYSYDVDPGNTDKVAFDTYDLLDGNIDRTQFNQAERVLGGSFPDFDSYTVTGQGIGGSMRPYSFQQYLYRQNNDALQIASYRLNDNASTKPVQFRFINDFSNRFEYTPPALGVENGKFSYNFDGTVTTGLGTETGYDADRNLLAGSKHIEWYTNGEIISGSAKDAGFINCVADQFVRDGHDFTGDQVGGFSITNATGVTYHYALPAYSYDEEMYTTVSATKANAEGPRYSKLSKPSKYAYIWFLTAVTGPDFVDHNSNGIADNGDYGYWVNFEYSKWLDSYQWRNPGEGTNKDLDGEFENSASGRKEIYYLHKIITQTHVAVFETSKRIDGREVVSLQDGGFNPPVIDGTTTPDMSKAPRACAKLDRIKLYQFESFALGHLDESKLLRQIEFGYDSEHPLAAGTPNSYDDDDTSLTKKGKLTLKTLSFLGKNGSDLIPPMTFGYAYNPSYQKDFTDVWGYYKSDFDANYLKATNEITGRLTTTESSENTDAWSLTNITTAVGAEIKIEYESDYYHEVELETDPVLSIDDVIDQGDGKMKVTFLETGLALEKYFSRDQVVNIDVVGGYKGSATTGSACNLNFDDEYYAITSSGTVTIDDISDIDHSITVEASGHPSFYNSLYTDSKRFYIKANCYFGYQQHIPPNDTDNRRPAIILGGFISYSKQNNEDNDRVGGGLRVKSIALTNQKGTSIGGNGRVTNYGYSLGKTSYEPFQIAEPRGKLVDRGIHFENFFRAAQRETLNEYLKKIINKHYYQQIAVSRVIPGPGVMYKYVTVSELNISSADNLPHDVPVYSKYEFETFSLDMIPIAQGHADRAYSIGGVDKAFHNTTTIQDFTSRVGNLKSIVLYSNSGTPDILSDDVPLSTTKINYLHDDISTPAFTDALKQNFSNQGLIDEVYTRARTVHFNPSEFRPYLDEGLTPLTLPKLPKSEQQGLYNYIFNTGEKHLLSTVSHIQTFPNIMIGQTNKNVKTNIETTTENVAFDFFSGEVIQALSTDSYGNNFLSVKVPAYKHYPGMGLKVLNSRNLNMLTQNSEQYSFLVNSALQPIGLLSGSVQTWSTGVPVLDEASQPTIWRPQFTYAWDGDAALLADGSYPYDDFSQTSNHFNFENLGLNTNWQKTGEITLYDPYSHGLEAKDINGNLVATRMNTNQTVVIASAINSGYADFGSSGAEYYSGNTEKEGGIDRGSGSPSVTHAHTGQFSLLVQPNNIGFTSTIKPTGKKYRASVWVYATGESETQSELDKIELLYSINGKQVGSVHPVLQKSKSKSWYLLNLDVVPDGTADVTVSVSNNSVRGVYFDDFRVHPFNASVTSFVYDPFSGELNYTLDANNFYTKFEYDAMGRLVRTSKELLNFDFGPGKESFRADAVLKEFKYNYGTGK